MADYQLNSQDQYLNYMNAGAQGFEFFLKGGKVGNEYYPKVDMSLWDQATMCGTCHVGGVFYEEDRKGTRLPMRAMQDWGPAFYGGAPNLNPITSTVWENYTSTTGTDKSFVAMSPWAYPVYMGMGGGPDPNLPDGGPMIVPNGWAPKDMQMANNNGGAPYQIKTKQLMMPNVKEMDCFFCHLQGYDNVMASVMTQAGSLSAAPTVGAGLFDMFSLSPTYMGYDPRTGKTAFTRISQTPMGPMLEPMGFASYSSHELVTLTGEITGKISGKPNDNNCMQCHATKTLKDFPEMFGVTGGSSGFLSAAPVVFDPAYGVGPKGVRMVNYDINAPFVAQGQFSPVLDGSNVQNYMMTGLPYPEAAGNTPYNNLGAGQVGGGNMGGTGPLYYNQADGTINQNVLKKSTMPFPRAEWFKRGDAWQFGQDVHGGIGCGGCHFTGNSTDKNQCDPGRGFDMASTVQDGIMALKERQPVMEGTLAETIKKHDTRNTVKRCEFCHITNADLNGDAIETYGAPNPDAAHARAGLLANITQIVDKMGLHGNFGGKGVPRMTNFSTQENGTTAGGTILGRGNHLDVMDCTVCHVNKVSMAVRSLDASSGMRYPAIVGTDMAKGMFGLFEDPTGYGQAYGGGDLKNWKPLHMWQAYGNSDLPLSTGNIPSGMQFRRKLHLTNPISALLWNNEDPAVDANGDGATGGHLVGDNLTTGLPDEHTKASLKGYRDIFTGDVPDHNNTAGFHYPIFDPWIQKDLKSGFNFGSAPLSVISVGFGGATGTPAGTTDPTGGAYESLYNAYGMFANDNWKYASVWSGAVVFTEPDQIRGYKDYRTAIAAATDGKSWDKTALTLVGAPFMVTHGVKPVTKFVKGKFTDTNNGCADCHAQNKQFFTGGFDMVGPALPATTTYDPGTTPKTDPVSGVLLIDPATGEPIRNTNTYGNAMAHMFQRPLEPVRIKAYKGDLTGYLETHNKLGQPREINLVKDVTVGGTVYSYLSSVDRSQAMYPDEDGAIYYKAGEINADGSVKAGATPMTGTQYAAYLEGVSTNLSAYGINVRPKAEIDPTTVADASPITLGVQWKTNTAYPIGAKLAQPNGTKTADIGNITYTWSASNAVITDANSRTDATIKFTGTGAQTVKLTVTDEEGYSSTTYMDVTSILPPTSIVWTAATNTAAITGLPAGTASVKVIWGDGMTTTKATAASSIDIVHAYAVPVLPAVFTPKTIKVYCLSGGGTQIGYQQITITQP